MFKFIFIFANGKMAIWKSDENKFEGTGWTDTVLCFRRIVLARLRIGQAYFKIKTFLMPFLKCGLETILCVL